MGTLVLVATPIGNLEDVSSRALRVLGEADLLLAEDTRRTRILLDRFGVSARPRSLHSHNEAARTEEVLATLADGATVAVVSDAGTPLVSDPGERLVAAAIDAGHTVTAVPGPSAVTMALTVSGLPAVPFTFLGFLPRRARDFDALLARVAAAPETLVCFESPRRLGASLQRLSAGLGNRRACLSRELTKLHEEVVHAPLEELAERFAEGARGEVTLVIAGADPSAATRDPAELDGEIERRLAEGQSPKTLSAALASEFELPKRTIYNRALALRDEGDS